MFGFAVNSPTLSELDSPIIGGPRDRDKEQELRAHA